MFMYSPCSRPTTDPTHLSGSPTLTVPACVVVAYSNVFPPSPSNLTASPFRFQRDWAHVADGSAEARYDWITAVVMHSAASTSREALETTTVVALDLGGASTQVSIPLLPGAPTAATKSRQVQSVSLPNSKRSTELYAVSRLNYGIKEAFRHFLAFAAGGEGTGGGTAECLPRGYAGEYAPPGEASLVRIATHAHKGTASSTAACVAQVHAWLRNMEAENTGGVGSSAAAEGIAALRGLRTFTVYAFDNYFKYTSLLSTMAADDTSSSDSGGGKPTTVVVPLSTVHSWTVKLCALSWRELAVAYPDKDEAFLRRACFTGHYIETLVHSVYGISRTKDIHFTDSIAGFDGSWALGAAVEGIDGEGS